MTWVREGNEDECGIVGRKYDFYISSHITRVGWFLHRNWVEENCLCFMVDKEREKRYFVCRCINNVQSGLKNSQIFFFCACEEGKIYSLYGKFLPS